MSNDNKNKDINAQIDEIINEVRLSRQGAQERPSASEPTAQPDNAQAEEFVDISSLAGQTSQPSAKSEKEQKQEKKNLEKDKKLAEKEAKKAEKDRKLAEKEAKKTAEKDSKPVAKEAQELQIETPAPQPSAGEAVNSDSASEQSADEVDKILSELPGELEMKAEPAPIQAPEQVSEQLAQKKSGKKKGLLIAGVVGAVALLGCSFAAGLALNPQAVPAAAPIPQVAAVSNEEATEFVFAKGISIEGIDIGGKNQKEAKALIKIKETDFKDEFSLNVNYGDGEKLTFTQDDFSYTYNTEEVFEQAMQYSRDVTSAILDGTIDELAVPEEYNVTVDEENGTVDFAVSCIVGDSSIEKIVNRSAGEIDKEAVEPHATEYDPYADSFEEMFTWVEGENGTVVDRDALTADINELFKNGAVSGDVTVQTVTQKPKHTLDDVKNNVQLIGQFSTVSTNTANATSNMATAFAAIDGTIVDPGENFSFNECTGDSNLTENGYLPASVIENEQYVSGIGGGICQASTTIYNAGIMAGMEIVERYNHFYTSIYVYGGLDATIDYGNLDLKMKNTTDYQIFIHTWMEGVTLYCEIYGWQSPEWDEIRTETECSWVGDESFGFEAERVYYKDGKEVKREELPSSVYSLKNGHSVVAGDPGTESTKIENPKENLKLNTKSSDSKQDSSSSSSSSASSE